MRERRRGRHHAAGVPSSETVNAVSPIAFLPLEGASVEPEIEHLLPKLLRSGRGGRLGEDVGVTRAAVFAGLLPLDKQEAVEEPVLGAVRIGKADVAAPALGAPCKRSAVRTVAGYEGHVCRQRNPAPGAFPGVQCGRSRGSTEVKALHLAFFASRADRLNTDMVVGVCFQVAHRDAHVCGFQGTGLDFVIEFRGSGSAHAIADPFGVNRLEGEGSPVGRNFRELHPDCRLINDFRLPGLA